MHFAKLAKGLFVREYCCLIRKIVINKFNKNISTKLRTATATGTTTTTKITARKYTSVALSKLQLINFRNLKTIKSNNMTNDVESGVTYLEVPDKSENDKKIYKTLRLANGITVLLISDPTPVPHDGLTSSASSNSEASHDSCAEESTSDSQTTASTSTDNDGNLTDSSEEGDEKLAACALMVDVGAFSEPTNCQGLAHFLEHMIFMGSEKYPAENAFDSHIKKCGGFDNANTDCEETLFYFEISEKHLDSSLDYFSALFKAPLMKKESMQRERESVESEYQQTKLDDEVRRDQLLASLARPNYPHGTFTWGNNKSLRDNIHDDELHQLVHEFRKHHYSAHRMYVCLQARLPIDEMEGLVLKHFMDIPNNQIAGIDFQQFNYQEAFLPDFHQQVYLVMPVENVCKLELTWVLPSMVKYYKCKPDQFLAYLLGHEGKGSLCAYLRTKLWGLDLICGVDNNGFDTNSIYTLFNLCIYLTDNGFRNIDQVLKATFAYIRLFADNEPLLKESFAELKHIEANSFRFQSQKAAFDNVQNLVKRIKLYPPKDIITGTELYFGYNVDEVMDVVRHLNEFKFNIMITSQQKYGCSIYNKKEKWFGTEYTTIPMPEKWTELWNNPEPMSELHLPYANPFISNDFTLFWESSGKPEIPLAPKKLLQTNVCELWFRQDDKFNLPEACMNFYLISPLIRKDPRNDVMCTLYSQLVKYRLCEELYPATVANLSYHFHSADKGILMKVNGYNEKLHLLVNIITRAMVTMREHITEEQLMAYKINQKKMFFNALIKPKTLNKDIRLSVLENIHWPIILRYKILDSITLDDMLEFADNFPKELYVRALMQGNLTEETAHNVMNTMLSTLNCQNIKELKYIENRTVQLPQGSHYIRTLAINEKDTNTYICNFYQIGPSSVGIESLLDLLMMFVEEPLFDQLRTKEQLGYYVGGSVRVHHGIAGYSITVNSQETKFSAQHVEERIEVFRENMLEILKEMPDDEFEHVRESLIKIKMVVDMSLNEEVDRNWSEIVQEHYLFDRQRKEVEVIRYLTKKDIIDFCIYNERTNLRKLSVQVIGNKNATADGEPTREEETATDVDIQDANEEGFETMDIDFNKVKDAELFDVLANKLDVIYLPRDGDATTITDIDDFKENLHVYPITKTKVEPNWGLVFKNTEQQNIMEDL